VDSDLSGHGLIFACLGCAKQAEGLPPGPPLGGHGPGNHENCRTHASPAVTLKTITRSLHSHMIRILFIGAIDPFSEVQTRHKPLWPAYLASFIEKHLWNDRVHFRYTYKDIRREMQAYRPDVVCISAITQNFDYAIRYARLAKEYHLPVVMGGMHISSLPSSLTEAMDVAVIGEGENTFLELMQLFLEKRKFSAPDLDKLDGIAFHNGQGITQTAPRHWIRDVDSIPHPKRSLLGYERHSYVYTARGCEYRCVFCSCHKHWGKARYASPEYILEEIEELVTHGARAIRFADENFVYNKERLHALAELILERGFNRRIKFSCWCRANDVDEDTVKILKAINIVSVKFGFESGSNRVLRKIKGNISIEDNYRVIDLFRDQGIQVNGDFLFGCPDESQEEIQETYNFIKRSRLDFIDVNVFSPLPGTPVWDYAKGRGLVSDSSMDWSQVSYKFNTDRMRAIILSETLSHDQLLKFHRKFQRLRFVRACLAAPQSPWLSEIPIAVLKQIREKICGCYIRYWNKGISE
jgi:anaerobic magnesium-protoporphyrin IX monomethyl ester cyclase